MKENTLYSILKSYQKRLTNLSARNKSLLLTSATEQFLDIHELDFLKNTPSFHIIEQLIAQKNTISLSEKHDPRFEKANEISKKLRKISRHDKLIEEERGSEDLYIGYPIVKGKFSDGTVVRCPLLFFPIHLEATLSTQKNAGTDESMTEIWQIKLREEALSINRSFLLAYSYFNDIQLSDEFLDNSFEDFSKNALEFRTQLYEYLKSSPLNINFNQENFTNQLTFFEKITKTELEATERNGELKLYPQAVLGIFPQAGSFLVPDYQFLIDTLAQNEEKTVEHLFPNDVNPEHSVIREEQLLMPFEIDISQEVALREVKAGQSLVVQGPPGTGKSQLICNLVADFTARGKKVLVVCQKRAALDVVQERLTQVGMRAFVGNVHDFKNDRKALYQQIFDQIEQVDTYQKQNQSLDAIFIERNFTQQSRHIDKVSEELQSFKDALFAINESGVSIKELYLTSSANDSFVDLQEYYKYFNFTEIKDFVEKFKLYFAYQERLRGNEASEFWQNRLSFQHRQSSDIALITKTIKELSHFVQDFENQAKHILDKNLSFESLQKISLERIKLQNLLNGIATDKVYKLLTRNLTERIRTNATKISGLEAEVGQLFAGQGIEITLPSTALLPLAGKISNAINAKENTFESIYWTLFSKEKKEIQHLAIANGLSIASDDLKKLHERILNRIALEKWWQENAYLFGKDFEKTIEDNQEPIWLRKGYRWFERHFQLLYQVAKAETILRSIKSVQLSEWLDCSWADFQPKVNFLIEKSTQLDEQISLWQSNLSPTQIKELANLQHGTLVIKYLQEYFDDMQELDALKANSSHTELAVIGLFDDEKNPYESFLNSLKLAWIKDIEIKNPILRGVSSLKIGQLESLLQESLLQKQQLSKEILLLKLRTLSYQNLEKNRLQNIVTYRDLKHQVAKKRKLWAVRRLIATFSDEIFRLVPCWLASPETVSAIFPMETESPFFDLIIFDEASQCFAEQGIPALFRGKQVVIAGDSKQLQPNDLYRLKFENDDDDTPALEVDSLLDLACQYLPQTQLRGHYRSRSLDLIDFSNQYFYKNTLQLLPDFHEINKGEPAIQYLKVNGIWENNSNLEEAETIISLVQNLKKDFPQKSIGIVTFNFKQQGLIQDLLEAKHFSFDKTDTAVAPIFVKNIENVQGDERDIIIFSIAYAPDVKGKLSMQFGSLNQQGGENRLNVAITRAKEKILIVSSIMPHQLNVEDTLNEGPKLLKSYLEYALLVSEGNYKPKPYFSTKYQADWLLKEQIAKDNQQHIKELPFADITVKTGEKYESLILTDDDLYYEHISPKETFAYIPAGLKAKGWSFERIYSRNFWKNT